MTDVIDGEWVQARLEGRHGEKAELARFLGIEPDRLTKSIQGQRRFTPEEAAKLRRYFAPAEPPSGAGGELVPVYDVAASAGDGKYVDYEPQVGALAFPDGYLRHLTSTPPSRLAIISVKGESMEPTLRDDDIVLVDGSKTSLGFDGLFVLQMDGALHVKRVLRGSKPGYVTIRSDNHQLYPPFERAVDDVDVVGKVLWTGRKE